MRVNKELFYELAQHKVKTLTRKYQEMNFEMKNLCVGLTQDPGLEKIDVIMKNEAINVLFSKIMDDTFGTEPKMTTCFIKNVSLLPALVSAVRENNFERHLQAEREVVKYCFAFDHINYARCVLPAGLSVRTTKYR